MPDTCESSGAPARGDSAPHAPEHQATAAALAGTARGARSGARCATSGAPRVRAPARPALRGREPGLAELPPRQKAGSAQLQRGRPDGISSRGGERSPICSQRLSVGSIQKPARQGECLQLSDALNITREYRKHLVPGLLYRLAQRPQDLFAGPEDEAGRSACLHHHSAVTRTYRGAEPPG